MAVQSISALSIAAMAVSALLSVAVPVILFFVVRKKYGKGILPVILGGAGFLLFAMILEQLLHLVVLRPNPNGDIALMQSPFLFMLYGALAAGIFEETARFLSFHILKKRCEGFGTALKHGIGHGGTEAILVGGISAVSSMVLVLMAQSGGAEGISMLGESVRQQVQTIAATPSYMFLVSAAERMMALVLQISLSVIVFYSVYPKRRVWLFPLAVLLHALVDCPAALYQAGVIKNVWIVEGLVLVATIALAAIAVLIHKWQKPEEQTMPA